MMSEEKNIVPSSPETDNDYYEEEFVDEAPSFSNSDSAEKTLASTEVASGSDDAGHSSPALQTVNEDAAAASKANSALDNSAKSNTSSKSGRRSRLRPNLGHQTSGWASSHVLVGATTEIKSIVVDKKKRKRATHSCMRSCGLIVLVVIILSGACMMLLLIDSSEPEPIVKKLETPAYEIQRVFPGKLAAFAQDGQVAAIQDDFGKVQVYQLNASETPLWKPMGPRSINPRGGVDLSRDGTLIAFLDSTTRRPQVMEFDPEIKSWRSQQMPFIIGDDVSMDMEANFLVIGVYSRSVVKEGLDAVVSFKHDGSSWVEYASRIELKGMQSFELSPTGETLMISTRKEDDDGDDENDTADVVGGGVYLNATEQLAIEEPTLVHTYRLIEDTTGEVWERVGREVSVEATRAEISLSTDVYAVVSADEVSVFSYSGRPWGSPLKPRNDSSFVSVALSLDGRTMAVSSVSNRNSSGIVDWYTFPYEYDTGDDWEATGTPLTDEWELEEGTPLADRYGRESPYFGQKLAFDQSISTIAVQSGLQQNENVHFYFVDLPEFEPSEGESS